MRDLIVKLFVIVYLIFLLPSCAADRCNQTFFGGSTIFNDEIADVNEAAVAFNEDPSTENCNTYRDRVRDYIDELKSFRECVTDQDLASFDTQIEGLEGQFDLLNC